MNTAIFMVCGLKKYNKIYSKNRRVDLIWSNSNFAESLQKDTQVFL